MQYDKMLQYTPYLTEHRWNNIYVYVGNTSNNELKQLPNYYGYNSKVISGNKGLNSVMKKQNNHLIVIYDDLNNPFYNNVSAGYWWLGTDNESEYKSVCIWAFTNWVTIKSNKNINNHLNKLLYKTPILFGNTLKSVKEKLGEPDTLLKQIKYSKEYWRLKYNGLQIEGYNNLSDFYHDKSQLEKITKIILTSPKFTNDLPFNVGENIVKVKNYLSDKFIVSQNDSEIVYEKQREDFLNYIKNKFKVTFKNGEIEKMEWMYQ